MEILKLSYDSLPVALKPCFEYLSFFPEDEEINPQYLTNLWIAEGFIHAGEDQTDIGWNYIHVLDNLCLMEIVQDSKYDLSSKRCKMHDLLLDLAISMSKESQGVFSVDEAFTNDRAIQRSSGCRRILLAKKSIKDGEITSSSSACSGASRLRTLSLSQNHGIENIPAKLFSRVRVLRVLDLSWTRITALPTCLANFKLRIKSIKSLGNSKCLEYLDIRGCSRECVGRIAKGVSMLVSLQALRSTGGLRMASNNEGIMSC